MRKLAIHRKTQLLLITLLVIGLFGLAVFTILRPGGGGGSEANEVHEQHRVVKEKACGLLADSEAKRILGDNIEQDSSEPTKSGSPAAQDVKVENLPSVCTYTRTSEKKEYPTVVTVLPLDEKEVEEQVQGMVAAGEFNKTDAYGIEAYKESRADLRGSKYHRLVIGYENAVVTITVDDSGEKYLRPLIDVVQKKIKDQKG